MSTLTAIATARNTDRFDSATMYEVTYVGSNDLDSGVSWAYLRRLADRGVIGREVICRHADGSDAGRRTI